MVEVFPTESPEFLGRINDRPQAWPSVSLGPKASSLSCSPSLNPHALPLSYSYSVNAFAAMAPSSSPSTPTLPSTEEVKTEVAAATKSTLSGLRSLAAGGVGGVCAVLVGHPFDLVKVRLQTSERGVYTGAIDVVRKTVAREGLRKVCRYLADMGSEGKGRGEVMLIERIGTLCGCLSAVDGGHTHV